MKNRFSLALVALITLALSLPVFVFAQQNRNQSNTSVGARSNGKSEPPATSAARRPRVRNGSATAAVAQDFSEALGIIEQNYIDGNKLDFNTVYKSSIVGMLRTLDPHSNYFDKEEFDEMKTDQRSEYYGIGASIQNYLVGDQIETYVTGTFDKAPAFRAGLRYGDRIDAVDGGRLDSRLQEMANTMHTIEQSSRSDARTPERIERPRHRHPQPNHR